MFFLPFTPFMIHVSLFIFTQVFFSDLNFSCFEWFNSMSFFFLNRSFQFPHFTVNLIRRNFYLHTG